MDQAPLSFSKRMKNCCRIHWNGMFYIITPFIFIELLVLQPVKENRTLFVLILGFLWYSTDVMAPGVVAGFPIIFYPFFGVVSGQRTCMSYCSDSQFVYILSCFISISFYNAKVDRYVAIRFLKVFGLKPRVLLISLMVLTFVLSGLVTETLACTIAMPLVLSCLEVMDEIGVCTKMDEEVVLKDDDLPYPSEVSKAFYIGVAYSATMGGMTNLWSTDTGYEIIQIYRNILPQSNAAASIFYKFSIIAIPFNIILLVFTILYLQWMFLGLWRGSSHQIDFDSERTMSELRQYLIDEDEKGNEYSVLTVCLAIVYTSSFVIWKVLEIQKGLENYRFIRYSCLAMGVCFIAFSTPRFCYFWNYCICRKPRKYETIRGLLPWSMVHLHMPWSQFLVYGSSLAYGLAIKVSGLYLLFGKHLISEENVEKRLLRWMLMAVLFSIMAGNHIVANVMMWLGLKSVMITGDDPNLFVIPLALASSLSYLLPCSNVSNSYATGWGNLKPRHLIRAGIGPMVFGFLLLLTMIEITRYTGFFETNAFNSSTNAIFFMPSWIYAGKEHNNFRI